MSEPAPTHPVLPVNPVLGDGRTTLRRLRVDDAVAFAALNRDPLNVTWTGSQADMSVRQAAVMITGSIDSGWETGHYLRFAITEKLDGVDTLVGTLSLQEVFSTSGGGSASVGIKMLPSGRGTGCAPRAITLLCGFAFGNLGLEILHWRTTSGNEASSELARRTGFVHAARIPGYGRPAGRVADGELFYQRREQFQNDAAPAPEEPGTFEPELPELPELLGRVAAAPVLGAGTILLRPLTMADAPQLVENCRDAEAVRWTTVPLEYSMADAEHFINTLVPEGWQSGETLTFAAVDPVSDALLGVVDLQCKVPGVASVGINFGPHARGTGAAQAAVALLLDYAFDQLNLAYLHWHVLAPNWASRKLAWKLGFHFDGQIRGDYCDRGTPKDRWVLSLAAADERSPQEPWTGPDAINR